MATPFTAKYPIKKTPVTPINQSRVSASTAPNMSMAPKATPAAQPTGNGLLGTLGNMVKTAALPITAPIAATKAVMGALNPPAPVAPKAPTAPFGGAVSPSLLTPKVEEQNNQKKIPQNPPAKLKIAMDGAPSAETPEQTMARIRKEQGLPELSIGGGQTQQQQEKAKDKISGTQTTTQEQEDAANKKKTDAVATARAANIKALQDRYTASLGQSQEEIDVQKQLDNLAASKALGVQAASEQPIEMGFITGQQKNMTERAAVQAEPLKARLAALQAKRTAEAAQAKAAYEEATGQGANKPTEVGGNLVQFNPETGKYEAVYTAPATAADNKPIALSEGQKLVDPITGKEIATGNEKTASPTADMQNYEFAKKNGYTGTFDQFIKQSGGGQDPASYKEWQLAGQPGTYEDWLGKSAKTNKMDQYTSNKVDQALQAVDKALPMISGWTSGLMGSATQGIPGTPSYNLKQALLAVKANIGFGELQAMRAASPTGGALGQVAVQELENLQAVLGSLDQAQSTEQLRENLLAIKQHFENWKATLQGNEQGTTDNEFDF